MIHRSRRALVVLGVLLLLGGLGIGPAPIATASDSGARIDPDLLARLATVPPTATLPVFVRLRSHADLTGLGGGTIRQRAGRVVSALRAHAAAQQAPVLAEIAADGATARSWWIADAVSLSARPALIRRLAGMPAVASVSLDRTDLTPSALPRHSPSVGARPDLLRPLVAPTGAPAPNLVQIGAPTLWARGITGASVVVADLDTGVDGTQPDLSGSWRRTDGWFDPYGQHATPTDVDGHGTWTTSVMVGRDVGGQAVGVAPDARWIAARVFDDSGRATLSGVHAALQWALNPSGSAATADPPNVVNASWSSAAQACSTEFQPDLAALRAAGIVPVFAAGNSGPAAGSGTNPATLPEALAVGAVDGSDTVDVSSSRGPAVCAGRTHFPDLVAPGVDIPVDDLYGGSWTASGTSLAAPHVSGALALLLSAHPDLSADVQQNALLSTAHDLGPAGFDDASGAGRLDVVAAEASLGSAPPPGPVTSAVTVTPNPVGGSTTPTVSATLAAAVGGTAPVAARSTVDGGSPVSLTVTAGNGTYAAAGALTGPLADGPHTVAVSAADASGTWGIPVSSAFVVDRTAPALGTPTVGPNPTAGAPTVTVTAGVTETGTGLGVLEAFVDVDPGVGRATPATFTAGGTGTGTVQAALPVAGLSAGAHVITLRAIDRAGNATAVTATFTVSAAAVFADGFESGTTSAWRSSTGAGLVVSGTFALAGRAGLGITASRTGGSVRAGVPGSSGPVNLRMLFDPRSLATGTAVVPIAVAAAGATTVWSVQYQRVSAGTQVRVSLRTTAGTTVTGSWITVPSTGATVLEVDTQPTAGSATFFVADVARSSWSRGLTTTVPATVDVGLVGTQPSGSSGTVRIDAVVVNRSGHIGTGTAGL